MAKNVALLGDGSTHGGVITLSGQDDSATVGSIPIAVAGAKHTCPIPYHGVTDITPVTTKSYINGKLVVTENAVAGCGAIITPPVRGVQVE